MAKRSNEKLASMPEVDEVDTLKADQRAKLQALITEAHFLKQTEDRLKQIKAEIVELMQGVAESARVGTKCAVVRYQDGRATIKRELLVENGVTLEQIEASTTTGKGYWMCELPAMEE